MLTCAQRFNCELSIITGSSLFQSFYNGRSQASQPVLKQIVNSSPLHAFERGFFDRASNNNDRDAQISFREDVECLETGELREVVIHKDDIESRIELLPEIVLSLNSLPTRVITRFAQLVYHELCISRPVLKY